MLVCICSPCCGTYWRGNGGGCFSDASISIFGNINEFKHLKSCECRFFDVVSCQYSIFIRFSLLLLPLSSLCQFHIHSHCNWVNAKKIRMCVCACVCRKKKPSEKHFLSKIFWMFWDDDENGNNSATAAFVCQPSKIRRAMNLVTCTTSHFYPSDSIWMTSAT